jgi:hypothetical protein
LFLLRRQRPSTCVSCGIRYTVLAVAVALVASGTGPSSLRTMGTFRLISPIWPTCTSSGSWRAPKTSGAERHSRALFVTDLPPDRALWLARG